MVSSAVAGSRRKVDARGLRAAIYARVSTAEQVDGTSLTTQREHGERYADAHGWVVVDTFVDQGVSGAKQSRPELDRLMRLVRRGEIDVVIVAKLDRLGRTMHGLATLLADWDARGVALVSVAESFDSSTASGRLMRNILGSFAEHERDRIRERTTDGIEATVLCGGWPGGPPPFGWRLTRKDGARATTLELDEAEAATIRRARDLVVDERLSSAAVCRRLNEEGHKPRGGPHGTGTARWTATMLRSMLRYSDHFAGTWTYRSLEPGHPKSNNERTQITVAIPPLMTHPELAELRKRVDETATPGPVRDGRPRYLLTRRLRSPHGAPMRGVRKKERGTSAYKCVNSPSLSGHPPCDCNAINTAVLDDMVWEEVRAMLTDPERIKMMAETAFRLSEATQLSAGESAATLARRVAKLERALGETLARYARRGFDPGAVEHATKAVREDLDEARRHHAQVVAWEATNRSVADRVEQVWARAEQIGASLDAADPVIRREVIELLDIRVQITSWSSCSTCAGKGWLPARLDSPRAAGEGGGTRRRGVRCPECCAHRWTPQLVMTGVIPVPSSQASTATDGVPFSLVADAG